MVKTAPRKTVPLLLSCVVILQLLAHGQPAAAQPLHPTAISAAAAPDLMCAPRNRSMVREVRLAGHIMGFSEVCPSAETCCDVALRLGATSFTYNQNASHTPIDPDCRVFGALAPKSMWQKCTSCVSFVANATTITNPPGLFAEAPAATTTPTANTPGRLRLSLDASLNIVVTFSTASKPILPLVRYGVDAKNLASWARPMNPPTTYYYALKNYTSSFIGHATLGPLTPGKTYFYAVESEPGVASSVHSFIAPALKHGADQSLRIALIGDLGQTVNSSTTIEHIRAATSSCSPSSSSLSSSTFEALVIVGDMSYADAEQPPENCPHPGGCDPRRWDTWEDFFQPLGSCLPTMVLPGNHEIETEDAPLEARERDRMRLSPHVPARDPDVAHQPPFLNYKERFPMPRAGGGAEVGDFFYSFDLGPAHFVFLNSYDSFVDENWSNTKSRQFMWLQQDLNAVSRDRTPWVIMAFHAPWYNSNTAHHNEKEETLLRELMEDTVFNSQVDVVFSGHVHAYERSKPVYKNVATPGAPTYLNIGDGGNREGPAYDFYQQPAWSEFREAVFGHGDLMIYNATHAQWTWHSNLHSAPTTKDSVWFRRRANGSGGVETLREKLD